MRFLQKNVLDGVGQNERIPSVFAGVGTCQNGDQTNDTECTYFEHSLRRRLFWRLHQ
jgi:hypothetical protein